MLAPRDNFRRVILLALNKRIQMSEKTMDAVGRLGDTALDEMGVNDNATHADKLGKWAEDAVRGIQTALFFTCIEISYYVKRSDAPTHLRFELRTTPTHRTHRAHSLSF